MKGLINQKGQLLRVEKGKVLVSEEPTTFPDDATLESVGKAHKLNQKGLKLVALDVIIDKPKPRYEVAKAKRR
jgi:hypothetical protein